MIFTGERYIPTEQGQIRLEHYHRHAITLDVIRGKRVLDLACGEGYGSFLMAEVADAVVGVDISDDAVKHAAAYYPRKNLSFYQGSVTRLPFPEDHFDVVVSFETIEHLDSQDEMLAEVKRVMRTDGVLIISSPNRPVYSAEKEQPNHFHVRELDYSELDVLLRAQFSNVRYFGQRTMMASVIQPLNEASSSCSVWSDDGSSLRAKASTMVDPVYYLAVCSSTIPIPVKIRMSALYPESLDLLKHYVGFAKWAKTLEKMVSDRDSQITIMKKRLDSE